MTASPDRSKSEGFVRVNDLLVRPEFESLMRKNNLTSVAAIFELRESAGDQTNKSLNKPGLDRWRERLRVTLRDGDATRVCYLKRYDHAPRQALREMSRSQTGARSLAGIEWHWLNELQAAEIPCATPIGLGQEFDGSREVRSAILVAEVPGRSLESLFADSMRDRPPVARAPGSDSQAKPELPTAVRGAERELVRRLIPHLAALVARFHAAGFVHRDLYLSHIFHDAQANDQSSLRLIDLQRVLRPRYFRERWIVKDLAALNYSAPSPLITRTDRLRWLKEYLEVLERPPELCRVAPRRRRRDDSSPPTRGGATGRGPVGAISSFANAHAYGNPSLFQGEGAGEGQSSRKENDLSMRKSGKLNSAARRLAYRVIGKTLSIARHDEARSRKLSI